MGESVHCRTKLVHLIGSDIAWINVARGSLWQDWMDFLHHLSQELDESRELELCSSSSMG